MSPQSPAAAAEDRPLIRARPLRRDAERNRQAILRAAAEVISERGLDASLDDVARRAGVGIGTVYRHFPGKEALAEAIFEESLIALVGIAERSLTEPDPWVGLVTYIERAAELLSADRGLRQILMFATFGRDQASQARALLQPAVTRLVERAQVAGVLRADVQSTDIPLAVIMLSAAADYTRPVRPQTWRRYLALILDAMSVSRAMPSSLPESALTPDEMELALQSGRGRCQVK
jgi:AcrR family transcriptional regulator